MSQDVDGTLRYVDSSGYELALKPQDISERVQSGKSIMPDGLAGTMTLQEFRDLLAYLQQPKP